MEPVSWYPSFSPPVFPPVIIKDKVSEFVESFYPNIQIYVHYFYTLLLIN